MMFIIPFVAGAPFNAQAEAESYSQTVYTVKAYADKVGGHVNIYQEPKEDSEVIARYFDGTTLAVVDIEEEGFHKVILDDGVGYIKSQNITTGISYNQRIALAIGLVCIVAVVLILVITYYRRNANYLKNKKK